MKEGDVVLTPLPQAGGVIKNRPAVALCQMPPFGDWLVCGISTQLHQRVAEFDEIVNVSDSDFAGSGLKAPSLIRLGFLAVMPASQFLGVIGSISKERRERLLGKLSEYLRARELS
jgi:mRNA interferase MazF